MFMKIKIGSSGNSFAKNEITSLIPTIPFFIYLKKTTEKDELKYERNYFV